MSMKDLLSQDEIDALLNGVSSNTIETVDHSLHDHDVENFSSYDFAHQERVFRGRIPSLDIVNERFARGFRNNLFKMLRRGIEVNVSSVQMLKYSEYVYSLVIPTSLTVVKLHPLRGTGLLVLDPKLVFTVVDNYFGGDGRLQAKFEGRDFAPTELRMIQRMMDMIFVDLQEAWRPVVEVELEYVNTEVNPQFANIVRPNDIVVVTSFSVEIEGIGGEFHIALPYSLLEPIRDRLDTVINTESSNLDMRWSNALRDELEHSLLNVTCELARKELSLRDIVDLQQGDVIPIDLSGLATLCAEGVALFKGKLEKTKGNNAVRIVAPANMPSRKLRSITEEVIDE